MATITTISETVGANRIVPTIAIPYPVGNPKLSAEDEHAARKALVMKALNALVTKIDSITVFE